VGIIPSREAPRAEVQQSDDQAKKDANRNPSDGSVRKTLDERAAGYPLKGKG